MAYFRVFMLSITLVSGFHNILISKCPCTAKGIRTLRKIEIRDLLASTPPWQLSTSAKPTRFVRTSTASLAEHANHLIVAAAVAEELQHHPDILLTHAELQVSIFTHAQQELTEKDATFIKKYEAELIQKINPLELPTLSVPAEASLAFFLEKNPDWINTNSALTLNKEVSDFTSAAFFLFACCTTDDIAHYIEKITLEYGSFSITLSSSDESKIIRAGQICSLLFSHVITREIK